ncbi:MAG: hypothetical protein MSQ05_06595 [Akkermansia sp.]|nr:hypothetical protein [Akkermansia sp.]
MEVLTSRFTGGRIFDELPPPIGTSEIKSNAPFFPGEVLTAVAADFATFATALPTAAPIPPCEGGVSIKSAAKQEKMEIFITCTNETDFQNEVLVR